MATIDTCNVCEGSGPCRACLGAEAIERERAARMKLEQQVRALRILAEAPVFDERAALVRLCIAIRALEGPNE